MRTYIVGRYWWRSRRFRASPVSMRSCWARGWRVCLLLGYFGEFMTRESDRLRRHAPGPVSVTLAKYQGGGRRGFFIRMLDGEIPFDNDEVPLTCGSGASRSRCVTGSSTISCHRDHWWMRQAVILAAGLDARAYRLAGQRARWCSRLTSPR